MFPEPCPGNAGSCCEGALHAYSHGTGRCRGAHPKCRTQAPRSLARHLYREAESVLSPAGSARASGPVLGLSARTNRAGMRDDTDCNLPNHSNYRWLYTVMAILDGLSVIRGAGAIPVYRVWCSAARPVAECLVAPARVLMYTWLVLAAVRAV